MELKDPMASPTEAPVIGPSPKPERDVTEQPNMATSAVREPLSTNEAGLSTSPRVEPISTMENVPDDTLSKEPPVRSDPGLLPAFGDPEAVIARVLSAPVVNKTDPIPLPIEIAKETTPSSEADNIVESQSVVEKSEIESKRAIIEAKPKVKEPTEPLSKRIAPPVAASTETRVSGPSPTTTDKPKGESKVSSWLKKFSRRPDKLSKTEPKLLTKEAPKNTTKAVSSGSEPPVANTSTASPAERDGSIREIAMAGKGADSTGVATNDNADLYDASPETKAKRASTSPSVSSISSDEDTRGRSPLRRQATGSSRGEEFEEARDYFDSEQLAPPTTFAAGRVSDSPVRDSRFQEQL